MRLARIGDRGSERPAIAVSGGFLDASDVCEEFDRSFFENGGVDRLRTLAIDQLSASVISLDTVRVGSPIPRPGKIIGIGLNYKDHADEAGAEVAAEPAIFLKAPNAMVGPYDQILIPLSSTKTDWEVELGVVIGIEARYLPSPEASLQFVAGFVVSNDVSERTFQLERGGQWTKGKSFETFNPVGPWLVTPDEINDVQNLGMWSYVNGVQMQMSNTRNMIFDVAYLVWYLSQFMVLEPGDLITTGTPAGVGLGRDLFLRPGDSVRLGIERLGEQLQTCRRASRNPFA